MVLRDPSDQLLGAKIGDVASWIFRFSIFPAPQTSPQACFRRSKMARFPLQSIASALAIPLSLLFVASEERRDCSFVRDKQGVVIERRGTKVGHVYQLLGHVNGDDVVVEPYLIEIKEEAETYTGFQHAGTEFIYMLTGEVVYRHGNKNYRLRPGDSMLFDSGALHGPELLVKRPMTYLSVIIYPRRRA